jgi:hypothetical protein
VEAVILDFWHAAEYLGDLGPRTNQLPGLDDLAFKLLEHQEFCPCDFFSGVCVMPYNSAVEHQMKNFFDSLSEKDRRRYAAVEATKLGHGGQEYVAQLFDIDPKTVRRGLDELNQLPDTHPQRVRKKGVDAHAASTSSPTSSRPSWTS